MTEAKTTENLTEIAQQPWMKGQKYFSYACSKCGNAASNTYCEPSRSDMLKYRLCFHCNYWREEDERIARDHTKLTIINGHIYSPGNRTSGPMRGMAGRRFDIEYIEPSAYAGQRITTFDLWAVSEIPSEIRAKYADTAVFLNGAERCQVGETGCWNPSDNKTEPYQLPSGLRQRSGPPTPQPVSDLINSKMGV